MFGKNYTVIEYYHESGIKKMRPYLSKKRFNQILSEIEKSEKFIDLDKTNDTLIVWYA